MGTSSPFEGGGRGCGSGRRDEVRECLKVLLRGDSPIIVAC
jgi:hypothetical protein